VPSVAGIEVYDTPFYAVNVVVAIIVCFIPLILIILAINFFGYLLGSVSRTQQPRTVQTRTAQI